MKINLKPWIIALGAVARRAATLTLAAIVPTLIDQGPTIVNQSLQVSEKTAVLAGVSFLILEYVQKWAREAWRQKQEALG